MDETRKPMVCPLLDFTCLNVYPLILLQPILLSESACTANVVEHYLEHINIGHWHKKCSCSAEFMSSSLSPIFVRCEFKSGRTVIVPVYLAKPSISFLSFTQLEKFYFLKNLIFLLLKF